MLKFTRSLTDNPRYRNFAFFTASEKEFCIYQLFDGKVLTNTFYAVDDMRCMRVAITEGANSATYNAYLANVLEGGEGERKGVPLYMIPLSSPEDIKLLKKDFSGYDQYAAYCTERGCEPSSRELYNIANMVGYIPVIHATVGGVIPDEIFERLSANTIPTPAPIAAAAPTNATIPGRAMSIELSLLELAKGKKARDLIRQNIINQLSLEEQAGKYYKLFLDQADDEVMVDAIKTTGMHFTGDQIVEICKLRPSTVIIQTALDSEKLNTDQFNIVLALMTSK